jgi:hypothetical protein
MNMRKWEAGDRNIGDCREITWGQMWQRFHSVYSRDYSEQELKRIHDKWSRLTAEVCGSGK